MQNLNTAYNSFEFQYDKTIKLILDKIDSNSTLRPYKERYYDNNKTIQKIMNDKYLKFLPLFFLLLIIGLILFLIFRRKKINFRKYNNFSKPIDLYLNYNRQKNDSVNMNREYFLRNSLLYNMNGIPNNILYYNKFDNRDNIRSNGYIYNNLSRSI